MVFARLKRSADLATIIAVVVTIAGISALGTYFYDRSHTVLDGMLKAKLQQVAGVSALLILGEDIEAVRGESSQQSLEYKRLIRQLLGIKHSMTDVRYVYIMRQTEDPFVLEFVADADAAEPPSALDENGNGVLDPLEQPSQPGDLYPTDDVPALQGEAFLHATADEEVTQDKWGTFMSGYAPIRTEDGRTVGVLGIDMLEADYQIRLQSIFTAFTLELLLAICIIIIAAIAFTIIRRNQETARRVEAERNWLTQLALHQIGGVLSIFRFTMEIIKEKIGNRCRSLKICEECRALEAGTDRLDTLFKKLQTADSVRAEHISYRAAPCELRPLIEREIAKFPKRTIAIVMRGKMPLRADPDVVSGILHELLSNAVQFSRSPSAITVKAHRAGSAVEIAVEDHGIGISAADLPHVCERLFVGKRTWEQHPRALGLGLYIAKGIVEHIGGSLNIESEEGKGTKVTVKIPQ